LKTGVCRSPFTGKVMQLVRSGFKHLTPTINPLPETGRTKH